MKKLLTVMILVFSVTFINAATVGNSTPQTHGDPRHPLCRNSNNLPKVCKQVSQGLVSPLLYSFICSFCPVCDENGQLVRCKDNDLPANGQCCVDVEIDLARMNQLPSWCKIDEGQTHPCGQCPVYYKKDHSCITNDGELGKLFPACVLHNGPGGDGECPDPDRGNSGKPKKVLTPVKPNSDKGTNPAKKTATSSSKKGIAKK